MASSDHHCSQATLSTATVTVRSFRGADATRQSLRHKVSRCSLAPLSVIVRQQFAGLIVRLDLLHQTRIGLLNDREEGWSMSSYATYCRDQATDCARRARLAKSADIAAYYEGALAQPCRARTRDRQLRWSDEGGHKRVEPPASDLDARHNTCANLKKLYQELSPHCVQSQAP